jgi:hypothetical protein
MTESAQPISETPEESTSIPAEAEDAKAEDAGASKDDDLDGEGEGQSLLSKGQSDDEKADGDADGDKEAEGAPETYDKFDVPEGLEYDEGQAAAFADVARKHNLSQAAAQEFVNMANEMVESYIDAQTDAVVAERNGWADELLKSDTFGGKNAEEKLLTARTVVQRFGDERLTKEILDGKAAGNNLAFVSFLDKVGKALDKAGALHAQDDKLVGAQGGVAGSNNRDPSKLYPNTRNMKG